MTREEELRKAQQGIGDAAYHAPAGSIGTAASYTPAALNKDGTQKPVDPKRGANQPQGLVGVSQGTQQQVNKYQQGYNPAQQVQQSQQTLQQIQAARPQGYNSRYGAQLDGILQQIQNPQEFKYEFNGDNLFRAYAQQYQQDAKQAQLNAQGQAAALTGGYGNSWAQTEGQQAYQQAMLPLYDKGMELYDRAYQKYRDDQQALRDQYGMLLDADQTDYGRYRDTVSDWRSDLDWQTQQTNRAEDQDYERWANDRDYWQRLAEVENADYRTEQERQEAIRQFNLGYQLDQRRFDQSVREFDESVRQFNESLDFDKMTNDQKYAAQYAMAILENGQMPSEELLMAAGLSLEDAQKLMAQIQASGGPGVRKPQNTAWQESLDSAMTRVAANDPANAATLERARNLAVQKRINDATSRGELPNAVQTFTVPNGTQTGGAVSVRLTPEQQTQAFIAAGKNRIPAAPTPEDLMLIKIASNKR